MWQQVATLPLLMRTACQQSQPSHLSLDTGRDWVTLMTASDGDSSLICSLLCSKIFRSLAFGRNTKHSKWYFDAIERRQLLFSFWVKLKGRYFWTELTAGLEKNFNPFLFTFLLNIYFCMVPTPLSTEFLSCILQHISWILKY